MADIRTNLSLAEAVTQVRQAAAEKRLVLFIGAGFSRNAGYPDWQTLLEPAVQEMGGAQAVEGQSLPQKAQSYEYFHSDREPLRRLLFEQLGQDKPLSQAHTCLPQLGASLVVTTNYERLLQRSFPDHHLVASPGAAARPFPADKTPIVHLHGHLDYLDAGHDGLILTEEDYREVQSLKAPYFERLRQHWQDSLILFLGYGAGDLDVAKAGDTVRAAYGHNFAKRHLALDLSGQAEHSLLTFWTPFCANVLQGKEVVGAHPGEKLLTFLQACIAPQVHNIAVPGPLQNKTAVALEENSTGTDSSKNCQSWQDSLQDPALWELLRRHAVYRHLRDLVKEKKLTPWEENAPAFTEFFAQAKLGGENTLRCLQRAFVRAEKGAKTACPEDVLQVWRNLCTLAIEQWVQAEQAQTPKLRPPDIKGVISLEVTEEWAVFLIAAAIFQTSSQLSSDLSLQKTFVKPNAPASLVPGKMLEDIAHQIHLAFEATGPVATSPAHISHLCDLARDKYGCDVVLGVDQAKTGHPLLLPEVQRQLNDVYHLNIVQFRVNQEQGTELIQFIHDFQYLVQALHGHLFPKEIAQTAAEAAHMAHMAHPVQGNPPMSHTTINIHGNISGDIANLGGSGPAALAKGNQTQAAAGSGNTQHQSVPAASGESLENLIQACLQAARAVPELAERIQQLERRLQTLQEAAKQAGPDQAGAETVRDAFENVENIVTRVEQSEELLQRLGRVKDKLLAGLPLLGNLLGG